MSYYRKNQCIKYCSLVGIKEVNVMMPYKTEETVESPFCGVILFRHSSRGDFESEIISRENS